MKDLKKLMGGDASPESDMKGEAKMKVLKHLKEMAAQMMGDDVKGRMEGMKKVTVAAPDASGLKQGLDKAKDLVGKMGDFDHGKPEESDEDPMEEASESPDEEMEENHEEDMTPDEIDAEIAHLEDLKRQLMEKQ